MKIFTWKIEDNLILLQNNFASNFSSVLIKIKIPNFSFDSISEEEDGSR